MKKGRQFTHWILRSFTSRCPEVILQLFKSYVIPRLEYASLLWSPYLVKNITKIEAIQRTITSRIAGMEKLNYHQRLHRLGLFSLQRRRERFAAIYMYKIVNGLVPNNLQMEFYTTSRHGVKCRLPKTQTAQTHLSTVRRNFFTYTGPAIFNSLPTYVKEATTLDRFKVHLDAYLLTVNTRLTSNSGLCNSK